MKVLVFLLVSTVVAFASELPLIEIIDPRSPSKDDYGAVMTSKDGRKVQVHLRTFGSDRIDQARAFGKSIALDGDRDHLLREKAESLYPGDRFFQRAFVQYAVTL